MFKVTFNINNSAPSIKWCLKFLLLVSILGLNSCGYFSDEPLEGADFYDSDTLNASCEFDPDSLNRILTENIEDQIKCIEENFEKFLLYVRRENRDYINEGELGALVRRFFHENSESILNGLRVLFELNMILLHDERDRMSTNNVGPLFELLRNSNREAVIITGLLKNLNRENYWDKRQHLKLSFDRLRSITQEVINNRSNGSTQLNLREFLRDLETRIDSFKIDDNTIDSLIVMKKALAGGQENILTSNQLSEIINKFPDLIMIGLDLNFVTEESFPKDQRWLLFDFYRDKLKAIRSLIHFEEPSATFISADRLAEIANNLASEELQVEKYIQLFESFKKNLIGGSKDYYSFGDVNTSITYLELFMHGLSVFEKYQIMGSMINEDSSNLDIQGLARRLLQDANSRSHDINSTLSSHPLPNEVQLKSFALDILDIFDGDVDDRIDLDFTPELIDAFFGIKTAFLGGSREIITFREIKEFNEKAPWLIKDFFNLSSFEAHHFEQDRDWYLHYFQIVERIKEDYLFDFKNFSQPIFTTDDLLIVTETFLDFGDVDIKKFLPTLEELKVRIIGGSRDSFESEDLTKTISLVEEFLKRTYFFDVNYDANKNILNNPNPITRLPMIYRPEFENLKRREVDQFRDDFLKVAQTFRYFRSDEGLSTYQEGIIRNKEGFIETALINRASELLVEGFNEGPDEGLTVDEVDFVLHTFRPVLEEINFWSKHMETFARNTLLLSDLFQSTSNGSLAIDVDEFTEFGSLTLMAMNIASNFLEELKKKHYSKLERGLNSSCQYSEDEDGGLLFPVPCYRKHFYDIIFDKLNLKDNLPFLYDYYLESINKQDSKLFENNVSQRLSYHERVLYEQVRDRLIRKPTPCEVCERFIELDYEYQLGTATTQQVQELFQIVSIQLSENNKSNSNEEPLYEALEYLIKIEGFARDFPDETIPVGYRDIAKILGALLNVESTFRRFDVNNDNIVDRNELDEAFKIYEDAILAIAELEEGSRFSKSIFLYMVKYMEIPTRWQLLRFHYNPLADRNIEATRLNIGVLLYYLTTREN